MTAPTKNFRYLIYAKVRGFLKTKITAAVGKRSMRLIGSFAVVCAAALALSSCQKDIFVPCVPIGVLSDAAELKVVGDTAADDYSVALTAVTIDCEFYEDLIDARVLMYFTAERAAANYPLIIEFPVFQIIARGRRWGLDKEIIIRRVEFEAGQRVYSGTVTAGSHFPIEEISAANPYEIVVGLQLDRQGLYSNQQRRGVQTDDSNRSPFISK